MTNTPAKLGLLGAALLLCGHAAAFRVMPSLNCYKTESDPNAVSRAAEFKSDGAWFITQNSDFTDAQWRSIFETLGGRPVSEDNPESSKSYDDYVRIMGEPPADAMCYNETGGLPGGTLLSDAQIDAQYQSHGNRPIVCLTRSYGGPWRTETDRCLKNPKVHGICMEYVKEALLENINAPAEGIRAILKEHKRVYLLLHAAGDGWTLDENKRILENLNAWCPEAMKSPEVFLVYQNYHAAPEGWFGPGGVKEAIAQACAMPSYTGGSDGAPSGPPPLTPGEIQTLNVPNLPPIGLWGLNVQYPAPTLLVLSATIQESLGDPYYRQCGNALAERGYLLISLDLPGHGVAQRADEPVGLAAWRARSDQNEDFIAPFTGSARRVLDYLVGAGYADANRIAACGTSRGGFMALQCAAADPRIQAVAAFAPVTDLMALREFNGAANTDHVATLSLPYRAESLAGRSLWLIIGDRDERVSTDACIAFARQVTKLSLENEKPADVTLIVQPESKGHTTPAGAPEKAAAWIGERLGGNG